MTLQSSHQEGGAIGRRDLNVGYLVSGVKYDELFDVAVATVKDIHLKQTTLSRNPGRILASRYVPFGHVRLDVSLEPKKSEGGILLTVRLQFPAGAVGSADTLLERYLNGVRRRLGI